jgi:hypothetical protein
VALAEGLQNALWALGGVPEQRRDVFIAVATFRSPSLVMAPFPGLSSSSDCQEKLIVPVSSERRAENPTPDEVLSPPRYAPTLPRNVPVIGTVVPGGRPASPPTERGAAPATGFTMTIGQRGHHDDNWAEGHLGSSVVAAGGTNRRCRQPSRDPVKAFRPT